MVFLAVKILLQFFRFSTTSTKAKYFIAFKWTIKGALVDWKPIFVWEKKISCFLNHQNGFQFFSTDWKKKFGVICIELEFVEKPKVANSPFSHSLSLSLLVISFQPTNIRVSDSLCSSVKLASRLSPWVSKELRSLTSRAEIWINFAAACRGKDFSTFEPAFLKHLFFHIILYKWLGMGD